MMSITSSKTYVVQDNLKNMAHLSHKALHSLDRKNNTIKKEIKFLVGHKGTRQLFLTFCELKYIWESILPTKQCDPSVL
jgi:hypothetical protein